MRFRMKDSGLVKDLVAALLGFLFLSLLACGENESAEDTSGTDDPTRTLAIINTKGDDEANISVIDYVAGTAHIDLLVVGGSCDMTQYGDYIYIVDKSNDRIIKFDPLARVLVSEMSVAAGSSPNSIVFASDTKAYITCSDLAQVLIIDPVTMTETGAVDISAMADNDGDPDQYQAVIKGNRLYVALRRSSGRSLTDHSSLAVIDITTDTVVTELVLATNGVAGMAQNSLGGKTNDEDTLAGDLFVHVGGSMKAVDDGAVEAIDTEGLSTSVIALESEYGGTISGWVFDTNTTGWAILGLSASSGGSGYGLYRFPILNLLLTDHIDTG